MSTYRREGTFEKPMGTANGIAMLLLLIVLALTVPLTLLMLRSPVVLVILALAIAFIAPGFFMLQPNEACVITLFGSYLGTERASGLRWTLPWNGRKRVSVRARNHAIETLK